MNIYLDIDGVLLTKDGHPAPYSTDLLEYLATNHEVFWLTTHCRGGENHAPDYLYSKFPPEVKEYIDKIIPTDWNTWKTDAIDFTQDFRWLDDNIFQQERDELLKHNCLLKFIEINLINNPNNLLDIIQTFNNHKNTTCPHLRQAKLMIGYDSAKGSLLYDMYACQDCGKYIDKLGNINKFEEEVEKELGYKWIWKETYMTPEELSSWQPQKFTRLITIK